MKSGTQNSKRPWVCIAYAFPPMNRSGTHRTAAFVGGLDSLGWQATVLTVRPLPGEQEDATLLERVGASTHVLEAPWLRPFESAKDFVRRVLPFPRTHSPKQPMTASANRKASSEIKKRFTWIGPLFSTPDSRIGWVIPAVWKGLGAIRRRRPQVIFSTSPYASAHLIGLCLSRLTGIPWVADFRDPWRGNPFHQRRPAPAEWFDEWLEKLVLQYASRVICNSPALTGDFRHRYPQAKKIHTILNGVDLKPIQPEKNGRLGSPGQFVFAHFGQFYGPRSPACLLSALKALPAASEIRLAFVGPPQFQGRSLDDLAYEAGVRHRVTVYGATTHSEAQKLAAKADALVLVGAAGTGADLQIPQKLFEYLAMRRPILALLSPGNPAVEILRRANAEAIICDPLDGQAVSNAMRLLADPDRTVSPEAWSGVGQFAREHRIKELAALFDELAGTRARPASCISKSPNFSLDEISTPSMMPA